LELRGVHDAHRSSFEVALVPSLAGSGFEIRSRF